jgi:hypothetical protein
MTQNLILSLAMSILRSFGRTNAILFGILVIALFITTYNIKELQR